MMEIDIDGTRFLINSGPTNCEWNCSGSKAQLPLNAIFGLS